MRRPARSAVRSSLLLLLALGLAACGDDAVPALDAGGADAGTPDAGPADLGPPFVEPAFPGLGAEVEILRDRTGIPHIYAGSDADAFYASGYMQATDRLFQMELMRRRSLGRLAEVFGESRVDDDRTARLMDFPRWGRLCAERARDEAPDEYALVTAWVAGVNARIAEIVAGDAPVPYGFTTYDFTPEPWSVLDAFGIGHTILFSNANTIEYELLTTIVRDFLPAVDSAVPVTRALEEAYVLPPDERPTSRTVAPLTAAPPASPRALPADARARLAAFTERAASWRSGGSNNWAVAGTHTENGRPLIAGDPHQPLRSPSLFWAQHLSSRDAGGTLDVVGFSFVGSPAIQLGHNRRLAWTATTTVPDYMDLWDVRVTPAGADLGGTVVPVRERIEEIVVKGAATERYRVRDVPGQGVLLPNDFAPVPLVGPGRAVLFRWVGFAATNEARLFLAIDRAETVDAFDDAVRTSEIAAFNFLAADAAGLAYRIGLRIPDRGDPAAFTQPPWKLMNGDDASTFWRPDAFVPVDMLPHTRAASRGWIASANNDPYGFTANGRVDDDPLYFGVFWDPGTRGRRIEDELTRLVARPEPVTRADMETLQDDTRSLFADRMLPILADAMTRVPTDAALAEWRGRADLVALADALAAWDRRMERSSSAAVVFEGFMNFLCSQALEDDLSLVYGPISSGSMAAIAKFTLFAFDGTIPDSAGLLSEGRDVLALRALDLTATWLTERFGGTDPALYTWGALHGTRFDSEVRDDMRLDGGFEPTDGSHGTIDVSESRFFGDGGRPRMRLESGSGAIFRMVTEFDADGTPAARVQFPRGNAGEPDSPHWADTVADWRDGRYRPMLYRRAEIEADLDERLTLAP
jgi:penicillin amidase